MICGIIFTGAELHRHEKNIQAVILLAIFVLQYFFEHVFPQKRKYNSLKNEARNLAVGILNAALLFIPSLILVEILGYTQDHQIGLLNLISLPFAAEVAITFLITDLAMYGWHRLNHTYSLLWRFHRFHHLDEQMNTATALRFHSFELIAAVIAKGIFFLIAGLSFLPVLIYETIFFIVVVFHHSNIKISDTADMLYRKVFSSPMMHRIHHSEKKEETNSNYGSVFSFWDKIFKTYKKNAAGEIVYGVEDEL